MDDVFFFFLLITYGNGKNAPFTVSAVSIFILTCKAKKRTEEDDVKNEILILSSIPTSFSSSKIITFNSINYIYELNKQTKRTIKLIE